MSVDPALAGGIVAIVILFFIISALRAGRSLAPWVPSSIPMVMKALDHIAPRAGTRFVDLGCGDGRIVSLAAKKYHCIAEGFEISLFPLCLAKLRQWVNHSAFTITDRDLFTVDLAPYDIIFVYGLTQRSPIVQQLIQKLLRETQQDAYIISYNFSLSGLRTVAEFHDRWRNVFLYQK
jgi:hypothetical protein